MARITIYFLEFDDENINHLARHGITAEEVEQVTGNPYVTARKRAHRRSRICMIGTTDGGRALTIVLQVTRDDVVWRPVTGWDATAEEKKL